MKLDPLVRFGPINRCIYIDPNRDDKHTEQLTDEHIVPLGINGNLLLEAASCTHCAKITGAFEQICLRNMFGPFRAGPEKFKTRRPADRQRKERIEFIGHDGQPFEKHIPLTEHPPIITIPFLSVLPRILLAEPPSSGGPGGQWTSEQDAVTKAVLAKHNAASVKTRGYQPLSFFRMLAKIAHAYAWIGCTNGAVGPFTPLLLDTIFGREKFPHSYIGGERPEKGLVETVAGTRTEVHRLELTKDHFAGIDYTKIGLPPDVRFLTAHIRLFAYLGGPKFQVVVGILDRAAVI